MRTTTNKTVQVNLDLNEAEARWLMGYVQNPHCDFKDEPKTDAEMREKFFFAIQKSLES